MTVDDKRVDASMNEKVHAPIASSASAVRIGF